MRKLSRILIISGGGDDDDVKFILLADKLLFLDTILNAVNPRFHSVKTSL
jgi:hypothetical protein